MEKEGIDVELICLVLLLGFEENSYFKHLYSVSVSVESYSEMR